ncbi:hypothetical protein KIN20_011310 [Parelaphostrongylus tenuis]|uniref:Uncharacterized protein n=1 Tax=Parelaphostrongylus tenuis TaxID=148309 RepID=A0AAD5QPS8_PARTN|nr:hypothetical protein KIN20_011310 [Parelaphostrongylus tenuis]
MLKRETTATFNDVATTHRPSSRYLLSEAVASRKPYQNSKLNIVHRHRLMSEE